MNNKITLSEKVSGELVFIYRLFESSFDYSLIAYLLIDNWYDAVLMRGGSKKDYKLRLRPRSIRKSISGRIVHLFAKNITDYRLDGKDIILTYKDKKVIFRYTNDYQLSNTLTGIKEQFIEEQYEPVDVKGRDVLDIGASIGDSAIYFALNGAK
jgi:hypothetical protein